MECRFGYALCMVVWVSVSCSSQQPIAQGATTPGRVGSGSVFDLPLWEIAAHELQSQRRVRLHYDGPDGDGTAYLILRLERRDRYVLEGYARVLSTPLFQLVVDGDRALYVDRQGDTYCLFEEAIEISAIPLGPLPFDVLPALLLGRLPVSAADRFKSDGKEVSFLDRDGRKWSARLEGSKLRSWTLWRDGAPAVWWSRSDHIAYLSAREERLQLRWWARRPEPLQGEIPEIQIPESYTRAIDCF